MEVQGIVGENGPHSDKGIISLLDPTVQTRNRVTDKI